MVPRPSCRGPMNPLQGSGVSERSRCGAVRILPWTALYRDRACRSALAVVPCESHRRAQGFARHHTDPRRGFAGERSDTPDPCRGFIGELKDSHGTTPIPAEDSPASDPTRPIPVEGSSASSRIRTAPHRSPQRVRRRAIRHA